MSATIPVSSASRKLVTSRQECSSCYPRVWRDVWAGYFFHKVDRGNSETRKGTSCRWLFKRATTFAFAKIVISSRRVRAPIEAKTTFIATFDDKTNCLDVSLFYAREKIGMDFDRFEKNSSSSPLAIFSQRITSGRINYAGATITRLWNIPRRKSNDYSARKITNLLFQRWTRSIKFE